MNFIEIPYEKLISKLIWHHHTLELGFNFRSQFINSVKQLLFQMVMSYHKH